MPKILCDFHSLHSYFYWNSLMSGSPQRNYWIFVCSNHSRMRLLCCSDRWNYVAVILSIAHSNETCEMKKKMEYDQSNSHTNPHECSRFMSFISVCAIFTRSHCEPLTRVLFFFFYHTFHFFHSRTFFDWSTTICFFRFAEFLKL